MSRNNASSKRFIKEISLLNFVETWNAWVRTDAQHDIRTRNHKYGNEKLDLKAMTLFKNARRKQNEKFELE